MSRPKNLDATLIALKGKLLEFDREHSITRNEGTVAIPIASVRVFIEDLKGIFFGNSKMVAPFYLEKIRELEDEMTYVKPAQFDKLSRDAQVRTMEEPLSVRKIRESVMERKQGIFRCAKCTQVINIEDSSIIWNKEVGSYEHTLDCSRKAEEATM